MPRFRATTISRPTFSGAISTPAGPASQLSSMSARGWTYGALAERVDRFGNVLRGLGVRREERVLICLVRQHRLADRVSRRHQGRIVPVPVNTLLTADDYRFMLEDSLAARF